jgi:hypothetical protein
MSNDRSAVSYALSGKGPSLGASGMTLKVGEDMSPRWPVFEAQVQPGRAAG